MAKILTWVKGKYQWKNEELLKAYNVCCYVVVGMLIVYLIISGVGDYLDLGQTFRASVGISASGLVCFVLGYASAIQWADKRAKKNE